MLLFFFFSNFEVIQFSVILIDESDMSFEIVDGNSPWIIFV